MSTFQGRSLVLVAFAIGVVAIILSGIAVAGIAGVIGASGQRNTSVIAPSKRTIYVAAIEPKGSASVDKEPFPTAALPAGGGYALEEPKDGKWEVETYRWMPSEIVVVQGDEVTLEFLGVNGASHPSGIEKYMEKFEVKRGQITTVTFTADKAGTFKITCAIHQPSMTGYLTVLPSTA